MQLLTDDEIVEYLHTREPHRTAEQRAAYRATMIARARVLLEIDEAQELQSA